MAQTTYYVVQSFESGSKGGLVADIPVTLPSADGARRRAERLALSKAGVVAFSRTGDPSTGDFEDAQILFAHGNVPGEVDAA